MGFGPRRSRGRIDRDRRPNRSFIHSSTPHPVPPHVGGGDTCGLRSPTLPWTGSTGTAGQIVRSFIHRPPTLSLPTEGEGTPVGFGPRRSRGRDRQGPPARSFVHSSTPHPVPPHVGGGNACGRGPGSRGPPRTASANPAWTRRLSPSRASGTRSRATTTRAPRTLTEPTGPAASSRRSTSRPVKTWVEALTGPPPRRPPGPGRGRCLRLPAAPRRAAARRASGRGAGARPRPVGRSESSPP